tara:strand:+ start:2421 stop:2654 length:234 start_codon:yes stop_codon:yes gene_type:complete
MSNQKSIINFMYFGHNYPYNFISKVWGEDSSIANHLAEKFHTMYERKGTLTFFSWFMELDNGNKDILTSWVEENYKN